MTLFLHLICGACGILALSAFGYLVLRLFIGNETITGTIGIASFLSGQSLFTSLMFFGSSMGLPLTLPVLFFLLIILSLIAFTLGIGQKPEAPIHPNLPTPPRLSLFPRQIEWPLMILALAAIVCVLVSIWGKSMGTAVIDIPGLCIHGLKAKIFFLEQTVSSEFYSDKAYQAAHLDYPIGYPLLITWLYTCMGNVDDHAIKALPPFLGLLFGIGVLCAAKENSCPLSIASIGILLYCTSAAFVDVTTQLYAEALLILQILMGMVLICGLPKVANRNNLHNLGWFMLASAAWTKKEGTVFFICFGTVWLLMLIKELGWRSACTHFLQKDGRMLLWLFPFILPWKIFCQIYRLNSQDFLISERVAIDNISYAYEAIKSFLFQLFWSDIGFAALGIFTFSIYLGFTSSNKHKGWVCIGSAAIFIACLSSVFVFSIRRIDWHLEAIPRLSLIPAAAFLVALLSWGGREGSAPERM